MVVFKAIFWKELKESFSTPMVYLFTAIFSLIMGWLFYNLVLGAQNMSEMSMTNSILRPVLGNINVMMMLFVPLLTMRCFSAEYKENTINLYMMSGVSWNKLYWGKFLATGLTSIFLILPTMIFPIVLSLSGYSDWGVVILGYMGTILGILAYVAIGVFASALTSNMIISAVISFSILFGIVLLVMSASLSQNYLIGQMVSYLSFPFHFQSFAIGLIRSYDLFYYLSVIILFYYLTVRVLEGRKW
jgi:ABC-2 type transport system permease protein